jgi:S1-C subfamily serine protease
MNEIDGSKKQGGQQLLQNCPKSFKPWILTLVLLALLTLGWVAFESYNDGGMVAHMFDRDESGRMSRAGRQTAGNYNQVNLPMVNEMQTSYHTIIDLVRPALVSIDVAVTPPPGVEPGVNMNPVAGVPVTNYTRVGSGVVISDQGYVLTSYHVVEGATAMKATVYGTGGAIEYPLKLVNIDRTTDLALMRVMGNGPFQHAVLGDSDMVRTGDVVLAMGSPFGFDQTITTGIISSRNRTVTIGGKVFEGLLQTDTPINQGNSGGPLVNARGEVVAINTAIYSPTGAFSGIGFAIPVNQASSLVGGVVDFGGVLPQAAGGQLAAWARNGRQTGNSFKMPDGRIIVPPHPFRGRCIDCHPQLSPIPGLGGNNAFLAAGQPGGQGIVTDPYIGASLLNVDDLIAKQFNLAHAGGVLVDGVIAGSPAEMAGLKRGDVILRLDGRRLQDTVEFKQLLSGKKMGAKAELVVLSGGVRKTISIKIKVKVKVDQAPVAQGPKIKQPAEFEWLGAEIIPLIPAMQGFVDSGVYVAEAGGILGAAGLMKGDVIKSVNNRAVPDMLSFVKIAKKLDVKEGFLLDVIRAGKPTYIAVKG